MENMRNYSFNSDFDLPNLDPEVVQNMINSFNHAIRSITSLRNELAQIPINNSLTVKINMLKPQFNKYVIMGCDCSFDKLDDDLLQILSQIEMCHKVMLGKESYTVGDLFYMYNTLARAQDFFEYKLEYLRASFQP